MEVDATLQAARERLQNTLTSLQELMVAYVRRAEQPKRDGGGILACGMGFGKSLVMLVASICDTLQGHGPTLLVGAPALYAVWQEQIREHLKPGTLHMAQYNDSKQPEKCFQDAHLVFCTYQRLCLDAKEHMDSALPLILNTPVQTLRTRQPLSQLPGADKSVALVDRALAKRGLFSRAWHRIVVDEADALRNLKSKRFRALLALSAKNRWWMTGTPLNNSFSDIVAAMLFLRDKHVCLEYPLQLDPLGMLRGIRNEQEKRARQSFEHRAYVLTAQMVVEDYPHLIQADDRLRYLTAPVYMFQYATPFRTPEEQAVYKRMQDELVSVLRELKQCAQLHQQQQRVDEPADAQNEEDMEQEQQQLYQELQKRPQQQAKDLVHAAVENVRGSSNPQWSARATVNYFYLRTMQAAVMPSFADKELERDPNPHYHLQSSMFQDLVMWLRERVPAGDKAVVYCMWTTVLKACRLALQREGVEAVEFYGGMGADAQATALRRCQKDPACRVLLAQTRVGGVGQTFTFANWVFFLGPWFNPQLERQALSRTHRMGQLKTCHVIWLTRCGTIHEIIRGNASSKMRRSEELLLSVDRHYPKVSEIYAQLTLLVSGNFQPRDGFLEYQQRELHRAHYLEQRSEELFLVPYASYRLAGLIPPRSSLWRLDDQDALCLDWTRLCATAMARVLQDPHPQTMAPPPQLHWLVDSSKALLERERQITGDYNERSLISCQVLPIGKAAAAQLDQAVLHRVPLHLPTLLAFLSCQSCRPLTDLRNRSYGLLHTPLDGSCAMPQTVPVALDGLTHAEVCLRDHSTQQYLEYTSSLVLPALLTHSPALLTRSMQSFFWASGTHPDVERRVLSAWHRLGDGRELLLCVASGVYLQQAGKRVAMFALGVASNEHVPEVLVRQAEQRLCQRLVDQEFLLLEPDELLQRFQMPQTQTRRGLGKRPVLHLRAVDQCMVRLLSEQQNLVLKHQTHEEHMMLCSSGDPCAQMAQDSGRYFTCTLLWENFDTIAPPPPVNSSSTKRPLPNEPIPV